MHRSVIAAALAALVAGNTGCSPEEPSITPDSDGTTDVPYDTFTDGTDTGDVPTDAPFSCTPGEWGCWGNIYYLCADDGVTRLNETPCSDVCDDALGCVLCHPGSRTCEGNVSMICAADGQSWITGRDCTEWGSTCDGTGYCNDACGEAESTNSYVGCEYWPTPLANTSELDSTVFDFRVVVANPNDDHANVTIYRGGTEVTSVAVAAHDLEEVVLPWIDGQSFGIPNSDWNSIITSQGAYRLVSDRPVTVSQFNPFEYSSGSTFSYTNDATLLLPSHVLTGDYIGLTYVPFSRATGTTGSFPTPPSFSKYPDYIAIVGVTPEPTNVEVWVAGNTKGEATGRFPDTPRGANITFTLQQGEVAHVAASPPPDCTSTRPGYNREEDCMMGMCDYLDTCREIDHDMTGSRIWADQPVAVFGGHVCAYVPYTSQACDHLEVQLPPIQTWGTQYVSAPMVEPGSYNQNLVRIVAAFDGTDVTVSPPMVGFSSDTLVANEWVEFLATEPFHVTGSKAIMVGQYILGQYFPEPDAERGDPAMTVLVPAEQYRSDYTFINPSSYNPGTNGQNYVMIVKPAGLALVLDGATLGASWMSVGTGQEIGIVEVAGGTHTIVGDDDFGMISFGLGSFTSYAYPAGLNLEQITIII